MRPSVNLQLSGPARVLLAFLALAGLLPAPAFGLAPDPATAASGSLRLPFFFEENRGQAPADFSFLAQGRGCVFLLAADEARVLLAKPGPAQSARPECRGTLATAPAELAVRQVSLRLAGANARAAGRGDAPLPGRVNYLLGDNPADWRANVPTFGRVRFQEVYPGVDLVYYGSDRRLELDFAVAAFADPGRIALEITGADRVSLDAEGNLVLEVAGEQLWQHRPVAYQIIQGRQQPVDCRFQLTDARRVEFKLGDYDRALPLVIDPVFDYATYFGGAAGEAAWDIAADASGAAYVAGETMSARLPVTAGAFQTNYAGGSTQGGDAFVAKFGPEGTNLVYLTYLGGSSHDAALALALDAAGQVHLTGFTASSNFPTVGPLGPRISGQPHPALRVHPLDGFVAKLNAAGNGLVYSAYLGGDGVDEGIGIAVDALGRAYVAGYTESTNLPVVNAIQPRFGGAYDGFLCRVSADGTAFDYFTYLGGTNRDYCSGVAADAAGCAYVTGVTQSTNFWTTNAVQPQLNNPSPTPVTNYNTLSDAFVAKLDPAGALIYSTFLGGGGSDTGFRIVADAAGHAYVAGATGSADFPVTTTNLDGAVWTNRGGSDVFVTKLAPDGGTNWLWSVCFGGSSTESAWSLALDSAGAVHIVGDTFSTNFPTREVPDGGSATNQGGGDVFVAGLNADGTALSYAFYFGGPASDAGYGIATDPAGNLYVVGATSSTNLPVRNALQPTFAGGVGDAFVARLILPPALTIQQAAGAVQLAWPARNPDYVLECSSPETADGWQPVPVAPRKADGWNTVTLPTSGSPAFFRLRKP